MDGLDLICYAIASLPDLPELCTEDEREPIRGVKMVRVVWAKQENLKRLYLVDEVCQFVLPVKRYLDYLAAMEKSPHTPTDCATRRLV